MDPTQPRPRVNGSMLPSNQGKGVCIMGIAQNADSSGRSFQLTASDNQNVKVVLQDPLQEYIQSCLVEVVGMVNTKNEIECYNYVLFPQEYSSNFDMETYDKAVLLSHRVSDQYMPKPSAPAS